MARPKNSGNGRLEDAVATLIQNQASFLERVSHTDAQQIELQRRMLEIDRLNAERFAQIDQRFAQIEAVLGDLVRLMHALPDTIRDKIGFKPPEKPRPGQ